MSISGTASNSVATKFFLATEPLLKFSLLFDLPPAPGYSFSKS